MSSDESRFLVKPHTVQQPWRNQRQLVATLGLMGVIGLIIAALYLFQSSRSTVSSRELGEMGDYRARLERENERTRAEIAELQSLPRVMTRAAELGFRPADTDEIQYIIVDGYRYDRPIVTPTPSPTAQTAGQIYDETLGGWLRKQWDGLKRQLDTWRSS